MKQVSQQENHISCVWECGEAGLSLIHKYPNTDPYLPPPT